MKRNESIRHIMTSNPFSVQVGQPVSEVRRLLTDYFIHHVPVVDGRRLVGMISLLDLSRHSWGSSDNRGLDALLDHTVQIRDLMQKDPVCLSSQDSIRRAAEILAEGRFHGLPIVDGDNGELLGIVTTTDLIRYMLEQY